MVIIASTIYSDSNDDFFWDHRHPTEVALHLRRGRPVVFAQKLSTNIRNINITGGT